MDHLYAWVSVDVEGLEGLIAMNINGIPMPLISSNLKMMAGIKERAVEAVSSTGMKTHLVEFERKGVIAK